MQLVAKVNSKMQFITFSFLESLRGALKMTLLQRIKSLCASKKITIAELERKVDLSQGSIRNWDTKPPSIIRLRKVADYFDVSTDYLLGRTETPSFSTKDERDIQRMIDEMIQGLSNEHSLAYMKNGESELSEEDAELLRASLEAVARQSKILAKEKFTRKDYRK